MGREIRTRMDASGFLCNRLNNRDTVPLSYEPFVLRPHSGAAAMLEAQAIRIAWEVVKHRASTLDGLHPARSCHLPKSVADGIANGIPPSEIPDSFATKPD